MTLEISYQSESDIPSDYRHLYTAGSGGEYLLRKGSEVKTIDDLHNQRNLDAALRAEAKQQNMFDAAISDALSHADHELKVVNGKFVNQDGLSVSDWLTGKRETSPHWFEQKVEDKPEPTKKLRQNPWSSQHWNLTEQGRVMKINMQQAERLAEAAGTTVNGNRPGA